MAMQELSYTVSFTTPAFLGNVEQQAQWRTPPFKALLRQWWRIAAAPQYNYDHRALREAEGKLFGHAWLDDDRDVKGKKVAARKSLIKIRLYQRNWTAGTMNTWLGGEPKESHPEVRFPVGTDLYLGYGPLGYDKNSKGAKLGSSKSSGKSMTAIEPEKETAEFWLGFPDAHIENIKQASQLMGWFGTLGSRSRNGWGSLRFENESPLPKSPELAPFTRPLHECLQLDWPHAIGADRTGRHLVWKTSPQNSWRDAMRELARAKIAFRTHFKFTTGNNSSKVENRHILAYPVTNHSVKLWGNQGRLGNQVRFKVVKEAEKYIGLITHLPCKLPAELASKLTHQPNELSIWQQVHHVLDSQSSLSRLQ